MNKPIDKPQSIAELCKRLWALEDKHQLLDLEIAGVKPWQASRMKIYYALAEQCGFYEHPHVQQEGPTPFKQLIAFVRAATVDNPFLRRKPTDIAVFDHTRSKAVEDEEVDIYSLYLCREFESSGKNYRVFERPFLKHYQKSHRFPTMRVGVIDSLASLCAHLPKRWGSQSQNNFLQQVEDEIVTQFGVELPLQTLLHRQITRFRVRRCLYGRLLDRCKVREVYLVVSYYLSPLIAACKERGITVTELQHGVINTYHLGYSFPGTAANSLAYFPDRLLAWGGNWPTTQHLPLTDDRQVDYGFRYFEDNRPRVAPIKRRDNCLLVVSQSVHGNALATFIRENLSAFEGWQIKYKLHPSEFNRAARYADLQWLCQHVDGFELIESGDVHALLAEASTVVGVFSTVLFEALEFGCTVYVCPLSGWEYMDELLEQGVMLPVSSLQARTQ